MIGRLEYHNPDLLIRFIGRAKESAVEIDGEKLWTLIDMGAQVSIITQAYCEQMVIAIRPLNTLLNIVGSGS